MSEPRIIAQRWSVAAPVNGCRWCGWPISLWQHLCQAPGHEFCAAPTGAQKVARASTRLRYNLSLYSSISLWQHLCQAPGHEFCAAPTGARYNLSLYSSARRAGS